MLRGSRRYVPAAVALLCLSSAAPASAQSANLFQRLSGSWSGGGSVNVGGAGNERVRCRADYYPSSPSQLRLSLRCASDSFNLQVISDIAREGNRISGTWTETNYNASGNVSGGISGDQMVAVVQGAGVAAQLTLTVRGNTQAVALTSQGQISATASATLRRQ